MSEQRDWVTRALWRRYERSFRQRFSAGAGAYWQRDYPMGVLANINYEQAFRFNNRKDMNDEERFSTVLSQIVGKRVTYAELIGKEAETSDKV